MTEIVIWSSARINFDLAGNTLFEDPKTTFLHDFKVVNKEFSNIDEEFLLNFEWEVLEARLVPQCHIVIIDSQDIVRLSPEFLQKVCACLIAFVLAHPMKVLVFYDILNFKTSDELNHIVKFHQTLESQTIGLYSFVRIHRHQGASLESAFKRGQMIQSGVKNLTRSLLLVAFEVLRRDDRDSRMGNSQI